MAPTRRAILAGAGVLLAPRGLLAQAPRPAGVRRLGVLMGGEGRRAEAYLAELIQGLAALGWHRDANLHLELRWARGDRTRFDPYAAELVSLGPDLIIAQTTPSVAAVRRQTASLPIVFVMVTDPVGQGFVDSLARPGGNITGFADLDPQIAGKWLEMLTQVNPPMALVGVLYNPATAPLAAQQLSMMEQTARPLGMKVEPAQARDANEIEAAVAAVARQERSSLLVLPDIFAGVYARKILNSAARHRLPVIVPGRDLTLDGALMSYGINGTDLFRRAAGYVDRILRGAKPGDLPVQYPTKFELVLNQNTATALGITFAPALLARADEVIE